MVNEVTLDGGCRSTSQSAASERLQEVPNVFVTANSLCYPASLEEVQFRDKICLTLLPTSTSATFLSAHMRMRGLYQHASRFNHAPSSSAPCRQSTRTLFGPFRRKQQQQQESSSQPPKQELLLEQDNLLHPLSESPVPAMRAKSDRIKQLSRSPLLNASVQFDCVKSGWPTHHDAQEYESDSGHHARYWPTLKQVNEDEHDLRSGRTLSEFDHMPGQQPYEETISMANWDVFFYTRGFPSVDTDRSRRHLSKLLTYPITVATVLHENSPYNTRNQRVSSEGLRSLVALRQSLHPPLGGSSRPHLLTSPLKPLRIIVLGARAESSLPPAIWEQLSHLFPNIPFHIVFLGPEVILPPAREQQQARQTDAVGKGVQKGLKRTTQFGVPATVNVHSHNLTLTSLQAPYEEMHEALGPFDPYRCASFHLPLLESLTDPSLEGTSSSPFSQALARLPRPSLNRRTPYQPRPTGRTLFYKCSTRSAPCSAPASLQPTSSEISSPSTSWLPPKRLLVLLSGSCHPARTLLAVPRWR